MLLVIKNFLFLSSKNVEESTNKIRLILLGIFAAVLPFDMFYSTIILFIVSFSTIIDFKLNKIQYIPGSFFVFAFVIILSAIGMFYSSDAGRAHYLLERQLAFIIFPILLPLAIGNISSQKTLFILFLFTLSSVYSVFFLFINALDLLYVTNLPFKYLFSYSFFNHNFSAPLGLHATYLSLYISMAIIFLLYKFNEIKTISTKFIFILSILFLSIGLIFLQSRNSILSVLFILIFIYPFFINVNKKKYYFIVTVSMGCLFVLGSQSSYIKHRFTSELSSDLTKKSSFTTRNPEPRIWRWNCAIDIIKNKPLFGHGTGDEMPLLLNEYKNRNLKVSFKEQFNTHNQYLAILIKHGIVGLIIFLGMLFYFFRLAIQSKNFLYLSFLILITIGFLTENIIDANKGIFFFAFFNTLLGYQIINENKQKQMANPK